MGSIARDVHLLEGAKPGIPKLVTHRVHSENASFIIKKNQAELVLDITGFQLEFKEESAKWEDATRKDVPKDPGGIYTIERLQPVNIYLVRARSRNLAGLSEPSNVVYLQTNRTHKPIGRGGRGYPYQVEATKGIASTIVAFKTSQLLLFTSLFYFLVSFTTFKMENVRTLASFECS
jgi:hypothetical protein